MPLQYVTGEMPFRHIVVRVEPGVFIPRPETEVLVDAGLEALATRSVAPSTGQDAAPEPQPEDVRIIDLCVGSGCVSCALATELVGASVWATDLNPIAIRVAQGNAERLGVSGSGHRSGG